MEDENRFEFKQDVSALKQIRDALELSRESFAQRIGVTTTTIYRWESGRNPATFTVPQMKKLQQLIKPLGIDISDLPDSLAVPEDVHAH